MWPGVTHSKLILVMTQVMSHIFQNVLNKLPNFKRRDVSFYSKPVIYKRPDKQKKTPQTVAPPSKLHDKLWLCHHFKFHFIEVQSWISITFKTQICQKTNRLESFFLSTIIKVYFYHWKIHFNCIQIKIRLCKFLVSNRKSFT